MATIVVRRIWSRKVLNVPCIISSRFSARLSVVLSSNRNNVYKTFCQCSIRKNVLPLSCINIRTYSKEPDKEIKQNGPEKKPSLFQRFKEMYRDYWYVLVPVHIVTSLGWFGGFYYVAKSGVDIVSLMENWHVSEILIKPVRESSMGYLAVSYALYKIATPLRYTITLGGTTISIKYLKEWGYIKPAPSPQQLKNLYHEQKDNILETVRGRKDFKLHSDQLQGKKDNVEKKMTSKISSSKEQIEGKKPNLYDNFQKPLKHKEH